MPVAKGTAARSSRVMHAGALILFASLLGIAALAHEGHAPLPTRGATVDTAKRRIILAANARKALGIGVAEVGRELPPDSLLAYTTLVAPWNASGFADSLLPGRITRMLVRPGQQVTSGQTLAELEGPDTETLHLEWRIARTTLEMATRVLAVLKEAAGAIPESDILTAANQVSVANNTVELTRAKWVALGLNPQALDPRSGLPAVLPIRSPIAGTVVHADLSPGKVVEPGEHLFEIINTSRLWARLGLLERDLPRVAPGMKVEIGLTAFPGELFPGSISVVSQSLDPVTHLNDVWVELANPPGQPPRLLPGMRGQARIFLPNVQGTLVVPAQSLVDNGVDRFVLVEEASTATASEYQARSVQVIRETGNLVELRCPGLVPGDRVVARGAHELGALLVSGVLRLTPETAASFNIATAQVRQLPLAQILDLPATVDHPPNQRGSASAKLPGVLISVLASPGQAVQSGQILAELFSLDLINLQLELLREQLRAELASAQLAQLRSSGDAASRRRLVEAEAASTNATETRDTLRRKLALLGLEQSRLDALVAKREIIPTLPVRAPNPGIIAHFRSIIGKSVKANENLFEIHDNSAPQIKLSVSEAEVARIRPGQKARVRLVSRPGIVLTGKVTGNSGTLDPETGSLSAWVELDAPAPEGLRQNAMAQVTLELDPGHLANAIPLSALHREGTRFHVFAPKGAGYLRLPVRIGYRNDLFAEVLEGLDPGDTIAVAGVEELNTAWLSVR